MVTDVVEPGRHPLVGGLVTLMTLNASHSNHDLAVEVDGTVLFAGDIVFNGITPGENGLTRISSPSSAFGR